MAVRCCHVGTGSERSNGRVRRAARGSRPKQRRRRQGVHWKDKAPLDVLLRDEAAGAKEGCTGVLTKDRLQGTGKRNKVGVGQRGSETSENGLRRGREAVKQARLASEGAERQ
eukprot:56421-Chlamydomonas_euryale.AAC.1